MAKRKEVKKQQEEYVVLVNKRGNEHQFTMPHALALLRLQAKTNKKGWVLKSEKWEFISNEITARRDNKQA